MPGSSRRFLRVLEMRGRHSRDQPDRCFQRGLGAVRALLSLRLLVIQAIRDFNLSISLTRNKPTHNQVNGVSEMGMLLP